MRDINRIDKFCNELAEVWKCYEARDLRFGQLIMNVLGKMQSEGRDPFFPEEDEMIEYFRKYFAMPNSNEEKCSVYSCEYYEDGKCLCCDDVHNPNKLEDCISYIESGE